LFLETRAFYPEYLSKSTKIRLTDRLWRPFTAIYTTDDRERSIFISQKKSTSDCEASEGKRNFVLHCFETQSMRISTGNRAKKAVYTTFVMAVLQKID
jgi:hypothetical protein